MVHKRKPTRIPKQERHTEKYENSILRRIALLYAERELWIRAHLEVDFRSYEIGTEDVLVLPSFGDTSAGIWLVEIPQGGFNSTRIVYYPNGVVLVGPNKFQRPGAFLLKNETVDMLVNSTLETLSTLKEVSFAKSEIYCFFPEPDIYLIVVKKYERGISMEGIIPAKYLNRRTTELPEKCIRKDDN